MQPPPRKGNYAKFLKNLHSEQINKLLLKNQHECDLLEDIRTFTIKRSAIEKSYSEALLKISSAYLNKKIPNIPDIKLEGGEEKWNMWNVWRTVLEENEKLARARLAAVEVFQQQIADDAKVLRAHKVAAAKKCVDQLAIVQKELQTCVQDLDKTKKLYFDEEHSAHDVRDKARDIEEKLKKKKGSFFQSITSLQKNSAKFTSKREQLEEKSTGARNDYLLSLAATNAHQTRYFTVDLQLCMSTMESSVFDKVAEYLSLMGRTELLTCSAMQNSFTIIRDQAKQLTREYNLQCCYLYYPVLKQHIQYEFDPCDNDPIDTITAEHDSAGATLSKEARRWATRIARENNTIKESVRKLQIFNALRESGQKTDPNDPNGPDLETKIEELKQAIRKAETAKCKAEARIECLREGGVNVDEWLQEAESLNVQDIQRSASSLSDHPSSDSYYDSDFADTEPQPPAVQEKIEQINEVIQSEQYDNTEMDGEWAMLEQERQRIEQLTAGWDDPTQVDWGRDDTSDAAAQQESVPSSSSTPLLKCTALYSYTAQNPDELTIVENEQLEVVGEGDGDGWLRARNYKGEEGYVPHNYLDIDREQNTSVTTPGLQNQISFSSVDYTIDNEDDIQQSETTNQSPEQVSVISVQQNKAPLDDLSTPLYCVALYDYDGEGGDDELTFEEGQIIKIINKCAHSVDDGWWKGEYDGRIGNFPSLVVEECDEYGEPLTNQWDETPPQSAPPVFTPPDAPPFVLSSEDTLPPPPSPPSVDQPQQPPAPPVPNGSGPPPPTTSAPSFSIALTEDQHFQYGSQFDGESDIPTVEIPSVEIVDEDGAKVLTDNEEKKPDDYSLEVAQIVITAATPMMEEPDHPFPSTDDESPEPEMETKQKSSTNRDIEGIVEEPTEEEKSNKNEKIDETIAIEEIQTIQTIEECDEKEEHPEDSMVPISSSTGSDGETSGPSTAENSVSNITAQDDVNEPKQVVGGRASIPDELEPHQLARLQDLKESNA